MSSHKVKIEGDLLEQVKKCAGTSGYASVDEFVIHTLEKELERLMGSDQGNTPDSKDLVKKRLQGLGYLE